MDDMSVFHPPGPQSGLDVNKSSKLPQASIDLSKVPSYDRCSDADLNDDMPHNGIKDHLSAQVLEKELDALNENQNCLPSSSSSEDPAAFKSSFSLDVQKQFSVDESKNKSPDKSPESLKEQEWMLLDLCFGLPLFNTDLNKEISARIRTLGLFKEDR